MILIIQKYNRSKQIDKVRLGVCKIEYIKGEFVKTVNEIIKNKKGIIEEAKGILETLNDTDQLKEELLKKDTLLQEIRLEYNICQLSI